MPSRPGGSGGNRSRIARKRMPHSWTSVLIPSQTRFRIARETRVKTSKQFRIGLSSGHFLFGTAPSIGSCIVLGRNAPTAGLKIHVRQAVTCSKSLFDAALTKGDAAAATPTQEI